MTEEEKPTATKLPPAQSAFVVDSDEIARKRTSYYDKWRQKSKEAVDQVKEEEEVEKAKASEVLGLAAPEPKSEAERRDLEKRAALREAKKQWEGKKALDEAQIFQLKDICEGEHSVTKAEILHRPVLRIHSCKNATIVLEEDMGALIKIFVDDCEKVKFVVRCSTITQHVEVSRSTDIAIVLALPLHTLQLDLVDGATVRYEQNCLREGDRLYHAGVSRLTVQHCDAQQVQHDYADSQLHSSSDPVTQHLPEEEKQYVTHLKKGVLLTERVRRASGMMPLTDEELAKVAGDTEIETAHLRQAKEKRAAGNEAFSNGEYMQSGVFYTQAMGLAPSDQELLSICLANRAACNLKLGRLEEALDDATACTTMRPEYTKGWFRKGIALHALKQYGPAIEALSRADTMDPKNKQIKEALGFAQVMLRKQQKEEAEKYRN